MRYFTIITAAGNGSRMGSERPKQYHVLQGKTVIEHALQIFLADAQCEKIAVVIAPDDNYWHKMAIAQHPRIVTVTGGAVRSASVLQGLQALQMHCQSEDWIAVHDAARPCLRAADFARLLNECEHHPVGGILAVPVRDTLKRADTEGNIDATVDRALMWQAQTPQLFRFGLLQQALQTHANVTDDAMAVEKLGLRPRLVQGDASNIKITYSEDVALALAIMKE